MKVTSVELEKRCRDPKDFPRFRLPEIAFVGRSNVGKSSLINTLLQRTRSKIAHVSARPGKTQALNFYEVNGDFYLVEDGLDEGERVVVNGNFKIDSALQIRAKPSMMSPEGGEKPPDEHGGHSH